jgi:hypothetical protein
LELEKLSMIEKKWTIDEVKDIIQKYKALTK